ncbi:hypothetical protein M0802_000534 [Mischocyttarus mexicanus]|nr:hypothetical protein M0802_000534 [Mischocyttarus mexicanus]
MRGVHSQTPPVVHPCMPRDPTAIVMTEVGVQITARCFQQFTPPFLVLFSKHPTPILNPLPYSHSKPLL